VQAASVFIVPLHVGGGTRLKILDAWAMGKAVVSTSIGCEGLGAISGETLRIADDPTGFAAAIVEVLQKPEHRLALGAAGRAKVDAEFTWRRVAVKQMAVYEALIQRPTVHVSVPVRAS
jgi:glycosyltransferase involved in cell wall biosynthesis